MDPVTDTPGPTPGRTGPAGRHPGNGRCVLRLDRTRPERAAAVVEFALVVPVFVLLLMGIIDFANAFNDQGSVRQGTREGARQLVVADWELSGCTGTSSQKIACITKDRIGLGGADTRVKVELGTTYETGAQVTVCSMHRAESLTGLFSGVLDQRTLNGEVTMRIEEIDDAAPITDYSETALPGASWSWC